MKLYMIRHGQSTANAQRFHAGWAQVPLTEQGMMQARSAVRLLNGIQFDRIYVSDLLRAQQTLAAVLPGVESITTSLLREINVGDLAGKSTDECLKIYGEQYLADKAVHNFVTYGGEDDAMHLDRIRRFSVRLEQDVQPNVAAFCHEGSIRCMLDLVTGQRYRRKDYPLDNGSVSIFEFTDDHWMLIAWNVTADQEGEQRDYKNVEKASPN